VRVAALGRTAALYQSIRALVEAGHEVPLIATCPAAPEYSVREDDFSALAEELGATFILANSLNSTDVHVRLQRARAEIAVSMNWLTIIGAEAISAFPRGVLNAHAGDLPRYRGNAPVAWAILQGEPHIGLTIHLMEPSRLDSGPIVVKELLPLTEESYIGDVFAELDARIPDLFVRAVEGLVSGSITPCAQDEHLALRGYPRRPEDGRIDWTRPARALGRLVRASAEPFAGAFTHYNGDQLTIWRARPRPWDHAALSIPGQVIARDRASGVVCVACGEDLLELSDLELAGTRKAAAELISSTRDRLG
jgi:methionyl-tRNA formyltransferase